ncbi:ParB/RepB/Spo0J family partition protein [Bdellovibrionota bacterium FG-1]
MTTKRFQPRNQPVASQHLLDNEPSKDTQALCLPCALIRTGPNPRQDPGDISELIDSIERWGVLQSVLVTKTQAGQLTLIAGHRRLAAAKQAGLTSIPCRIIEVDEDGAAVLAMIENVQRESLAPMDEILGVAKLVHVFKGNQVELAQALGKAKSYVSKCIKAAEFIKTNEVSARKLSRAMLFELAYQPEPKKALNKVNSGEVTDSEGLAGRARSGPIAGGRFGAEGAIYFKERPDGKSFTLRLNWDASRTPKDSKAKMISTLETILQKLRSS